MARAVNTMARCCCACHESSRPPSSCNEEIRGRKDHRDAKKAKYLLQVVGHKCERAQRRVAPTSNSSSSGFSLDTYRDFLTSQLQRLGSFSGYAVERMAALSHTGRSAYVPQFNGSSHDSCTHLQCEHRHSECFSQSPLLAMLTPLSQLPQLLRSPSPQQ